MAINKVVYGENTLIDLTDTTATADKILTGYGAYGADGVWMNGTATAGGGSVTQDQDGFIVLPPTGGGGGGLYPWLSSGAEKVGTLVNKAINLSTDTTYDSWTASTTAGTILDASATDEYTFTGDLSAYDFVFITQGLIEPKYIAGTPMTKTTYRVAQIFIQYFYGYAGSTSTSVIINDSVNYQAYVSNVSNMNIQFFYDSSGVKGARNATQCGACYMSSTPSYTGSLSGTTLTVPIRFPAFYAKCDGNRFATERKAQVDSANTNYLLTVDAYKIPRENGVFGHWVKQMCAYLNGE